MSQTPTPSLQIWGRANSVNVQKVLWCCHELDVAYERIDAGMQFGRNSEADYLAMNPNGRVPTLVQGDFVLWESNSIMRYVALAYGATSRLYPSTPKVRAGMERWLDWTLTTLQPAERPLFWGLVRTPVADRDMAALQKAADANAALWEMVDRQLSRQTWMEGDDFSLADIAIGCYARRWFGVEGVTRPALPHLQRWYQAISVRPGFQTYVAPPLS
ncbi:glutathione S-transferase [Tardiphaga robiniae]|uniref:glutathione S-transferase family protein n=1 Tax=Tardiphaga robiniae TaxID=943830 RepID=UPI0028590726|nr:glutathione S-transferase [Tardiphaga robiniae]MDR6661004.1 glutathione S-transferase [Tardiphaga robiniae]